MYEIDWIATMGYFVCSGVFALLILLGVVIVCVIIEINNEDKGLRELFIKDYVNSYDCVWVKIKSLPKSFKIGNVYFDRCCNNKYYKTFISYVVIDGKAYDNGTTSIGDKFSCNTTNRDLMDYILDNLDKVEEVKQ